MNNSTYVTDDQGYLNASLPTEETVTAYNLFFQGLLQNNFFYLVFSGAFIFALICIKCIKQENDKGSHQRDGDAEDGRITSDSRLELLPSSYDGAMKRNSRRTLASREKAERPLRQNDININERTPPDKHYPTYELQEEGCGGRDRCQNTNCKLAKIKSYTTNNKQLEHVTNDEHCIDIIR